MSPWLLSSFSFSFFFFRRFSCPSRIDLRSVVHLSWPAIPHGNWFSFPHIQGPRRSLRGKQEEWGTRTDQFPDASPSFGQFTISTRDRRYLVPLILRASRTNRKMERSRYFIANFLISPTIVSTIFAYFVLTFVDLST